MTAETIAKILCRRPPAEDFREQLFWLVDLVYACKSSGDRKLSASAQLIEDALGYLGDYLETGDTQALHSATNHIEEFSRSVRASTAGLGNERGKE